MKYLTNCLISTIYHIPYQPNKTNPKLCKGRNPSYGNPIILTELINFLSKAPILNNWVCKKKTTNEIDSSLE